MSSSPTTGLSFFPASAQTLFTVSPNALPRAVTGEELEKGPHTCCDWFGTGAVLAGARKLSERVTLGSHATSLLLILMKLVKLHTVEAKIPSSNWAEMATGF